MEITADLESKLAVLENVVRSMYQLIGLNMTIIIPGSKPDWQSEDSFQMWRRVVFLGPVQRNTVHLLHSDGVGLRGFLSYTPSAENGEIFINELQIRQSCQCDAVTFRRLLNEFASRAKLLPHLRITTYSNKANKRGQQLVIKMGFRCTGQTERGFRYEMPKKEQLVLRFASSPP
jgi:hypothetical protein